MPNAAPVAVAAPQRVAAPPPTAPTPAALTAPAQPPRIDTGFAAIDDVDAVPLLSDRGRAGYREYLSRPTPKAFAIAANGYWSYAWSLTPADTSMPKDPTERVLVTCERAARMPCRLYAVNGAVVWTRDPK
jgi:hypothetical protein